MRILESDNACGESECGARLIGVIRGIGMVAETVLATVDVTMTARIDRTCKGCMSAVCTLIKNLSIGDR